MDILRPGETSLEVYGAIAANCWTNSSCACLNDSKYASRWASSSFKCKLIFSASIVPKLLVSTFTRKFV